MKGCN
jgi:NHL repeat